MGEASRVEVITKLPVQRRARPGTVRQLMVTAEKVTAVREREARRRQVRWMPEGSSLLAWGKTFFGEETSVFTSSSTSCPASVRRPTRLPAASSKPRAMPGLPPQRSRSPKNRRKRLLWLPLHRMPGRRARPWPLVPPTSTTVRLLPPPGESTLKQLKRPTVKEIVGMVLVRRRSRIRAPGGRSGRLRGRPHNALRMGSLLVLPPEARHPQLKLQLLPQTAQAMTTKGGKSLEIRPRELSVRCSTLHPLVAKEPAAITTTTVVVLRQPIPPPQTPDMLSALLRHHSQARWSASLSSRRLMPTAGMLV
eukprot:Rmarinus@m.16747